MLSTLTRFCLEIQTFHHFSPKSLRKEKGIIVHSCSPKALLTRCVLKKKSHDLTVRHFCSSAKTVDKLTLRLKTIADLLTIQSCHLIETCPALKLIRTQMVSIALAKFYLIVTGSLCSEASLSWEQARCLDSQTNNSLRQEFRTPFFVCLKI